jgi:hypothetical protein
MELGTHLRLQAMWEAPPNTVIVERAVRSMLRRSTPSQKQLPRNDFSKANLTSADAAIEPVGPIIAQIHFGTSGPIFAHFQIEQSGPKLTQSHIGSSGPYFAQSRIGSTGPSFAQPHFGSTGANIAHLLSESSGSIFAHFSLHD